MYSFLIFAAFAAAAPLEKSPEKAGKGEAAEEEFKVSAKDIARFDFLKKRGLEKAGLPVEAAKTVDQSKWGPAPAPL